MGKKRKPKLSKIPSKKKLLKLTKKYKTVSEFENDHFGLYRYIKKNKLQKIFFSHTPKYNKKPKYTLKQLKDLSRPYSISDFNKLFPKEAKFIQRHKLQKKVYNKNKFPKVYTNKEIYEIALKFKNMSSLTKKHPIVASRIYQKGLLKKCTKHMVPVWRKLTNSQLKQIAKKHKTRTEFRKNDQGAYITATRRGILDKICSHMEIKVHQYTNKELIQIAKKYRRRVDFQFNERSAYMIARKRGIIDQCFKHMIPKDSEKSIPISVLAEIAKKYKYRSEFGEKDRNAYEVARRRGLLAQICTHMVSKPKELYITEGKVLAFIKSHFPDAENKWFYNLKVKRRPYIKAFELDIFIPSLNKAVEFDGVYWHSTKMMLKRKRKWSVHARKNYHKIKDEFFLKEKGIKILHITDLMWFNKNEETKSKIIDFLTS